MALLRLLALALFVPFTAAAVDYGQFAASSFLIFADGYHHEALGSGMQLAPGKIVTNCHVFRDAKQYTKDSMRVANVQTREVFAVQKYAYDEDHDICLLYAPSAKGKSVALAGRSELDAAARAYSIGFPAGRLTASDGFFLRKAPLHGEDALFTTNYCQPGSSGGGLFDDQGRLIGIVFGTAPSAQGNVCLAVPIEIVRNILSAPTTYIRLVRNASKYIPDKE
ncbi:MAG TPA: serine protease [Novimethylophilus sp.]|jgi:S1-C subfamily serine protease|uniref:S1 family peptidase n=1 Tax=Novimethylophilus sp. TaxID=2137426 RepID=UPI002F428F35